MADKNSWTINVQDWIEPEEWAPAGRARKDRYINNVANLIKQAKLRQVLNGIGADGKPLEPRIRPRADRANGKPLAPHRVDSRAYKWARTSVSRVKGTVTVWWSHGWGRILGYHARGEVLGTYLRNVIGFPPGVLRWLKGQARKLWDSYGMRATREEKEAFRRGGSTPPPKPSPVVPIAARPRAPQPVLVVPPPPKPTPAPVLAVKPNPPGMIKPTRGPKVIYLKPGEKPDPRSKDIQVIT